MSNKSDKSDKKKPPAPVDMETVLAPHMDALYQRVQDDPKLVAADDDTVALREQKVRLRALARAIYPKLANYAASRDDGPVAQAWAQRCYREAIARKKSIEGRQERRAKKAAEAKRRAAERANGEAPAAPKKRILPSRDAGGGGGGARAERLLRPPQEPAGR